MIGTQSIGLISIHDSLKFYLHCDLLMNLYQEACNEYVTSCRQELNMLKERISMQCHFISLLPSLTL